MPQSLSPPKNASHKAIQFLLAIITLLIIGKLLTLVPVMNRLHLAGTYKAAELVWFSAELSALVIFYFFARAIIAATPNNGNILSFLRTIAEPLTILIIVILGQELLWQLLEPFVRAPGKKVYFSVAIISILAISIWLIVRAYHSAFYLVAVSEKIAKHISQFMPHLDTTCTACGHKVKSNALFCSHCGVKITAQKNCPECSTELLANEKFCQHCGFEVKQRSDLNA